MKEIFMIILYGVFGINILIIETMYLSYCDLKKHNKHDINFIDIIENLLSN